MTKNHRLSLLAIGLIALCPAAGALAANASITRQCELRVDGTTYLDGSCPVLIGGDGSITMNVGQPGARPTWFAYLAPAADGTAEASWNKDKGSLHAWSALGKLTHKGDCWVDATTRICISH